MAVKLTILGSSAAVPANNRNLSAQLLEIDGHSLLFDCGEATQFQLKKYKLNFFKIDYIFISHLHGDHFFGITGLLSTMNMMGRTNPITIFSPPGLEAAITPLFALSSMKLMYEIIFKEVDVERKTLIVDNDLFSVFTFPMLHSVKSFGYLFSKNHNKLNIDKQFVKEHPNISTSWFSKIKNGEDYIDENGKIFRNEDITYVANKNVSYAYCSDTAYYEQIADDIKGVNILYHESTYIDIDMDKAKIRKHSTAKQAAIIAKLSGANKLILGHFSGRYKDVSLFASEASTQFDGDVLLANDGMCINL